MDISFNEDQIEIRNQARRFLENECPIEYVRDMFEDEQGFTDEIWGKMAEMGWMGMHIPEEYDGIGLGLTDLCIVLEEMGRALTPGPYFSTVMLAAEAIIEAGNESQKKAYLPKISMGETRGTLALSEPDSGPEPGYIQMEARSEGDGFVLNGAKLFVPDAHTSDFMVCAARTEPGDDPAQGITLFLVDTKADGLSITPLKTMDRTRKQCEVKFDGVCISIDEVLGEVHKGWGALFRMLQRAQIGLGADSVGGAQKAMEIAVEYAKIRHQFNQPIGAFQAIKHNCANMLVDVESARSLLYYTVWAQEEEDSGPAALAASALKSFATDAYRNVATSGVQVMGGIGCTWEHDMHFYLKRAKFNQVALGDSAFHREEVTRLLGI
ncbi:MAG: acyl-CoA/acyl-ACP dehydrogenase [Deltaproteobacteria bacterium]|nr:acyl-CoA/acyl-ACP dehydrogenase [Deltaproteobacteria bacterium]